MTDSRVAKKYATALFQVAREAGAEQTVWEDLTALRDSLTADQKLLRVLASPQLSLEEKKGLVEAVAGTDAHPLVRNLLQFLVDKGRTGPLLSMIGIYRHLLDESSGVVEGTITSAVPLSDEQERQIVDRLERMSGKQVRHRCEVDPEILGGVVVILGGQIFDHSVRNDLSRLRDQLRGVKVHEAA